MAAAERQHSHDKECPLSLLTPLTLTPPHTQILDEPSAVADAERQQHDEERLEGIEEAKSVAARWEERGEDKDDPP